MHDAFNRLQRHTHLARVMGLGLRDFASDKGIGPGSNGCLEVALRAAGAPCYFFYSCLRILNKRYRPI